MPALCWPLNGVTAPGQPRFDASLGESNQSPRWYICMGLNGGFNDASGNGPLKTTGAGAEPGATVNVSPDMLDGLPIIVSLDIRLIPRNPKRCFGHLDYKEVEIGIRRQTACVDRHVFGSSRRHHLDARPGVRKTGFRARRHAHVTRDVITLTIPRSRRTPRSKADRHAVSSCRHY